MKYLKLMRIHQYVKNGFLFLPMFFALQITELDLLWRTALTALGFSFVASCIYILNDYVDRDADRQHPKKKNRPLASGAIKPPQAFILMGVLLVMGFGFIFLASPRNLNPVWLTLGYLLMNTAYSLKLKHIPILDITLIAIGFVLRINIGAEAGDIELSMWIILMTFLLALFLGLAKRRSDVLLAMDGKKVRKSIDGYNLQFVNGAMMIMASVTIVAYISYTISPDVIKNFGQDKLFYTVLFVILGILRYMQITFVKEDSGSPTKVLLKDIFLQLTILGWIASFVLLIYLKRGDGS